MAAIKRFLPILLFAIVIFRFNSSVANAAKDPGEVPMQPKLYDAIRSHSFAYAVVRGDSLYKIAKEYGTTVELLKHLNGLEGDVIYPAAVLQVPRGTFSIRVDKSDNVLGLVLDGELIKQYPVATGKENNTPVGKFEIVNKVMDPTWYKAGAVIPPDSPDNFLGTRWMGFDLKGYGIHGTIEPEKIGRQVSSGCVRMLNQDVEELFSLIPRGVEVEVVD